MQMQYHDGILTISQGEQEVRIKVSGYHRVLFPYTVAETLIDSFDVPFEELPFDEVFGLIRRIPSEDYGQNLPSLSDEAEDLFDELEDLLAERICHVKERMGKADSLSELDLAKALTAMMFLRSTVQRCVFIEHENGEEYGV